MMLAESKVRHRMSEWFVGGHMGVLQSLDVNPDEKVPSCSPSLLAVRTLHK